MLRLTEPPKVRKHRRPLHPIVQTLRLERYKRRITCLELAETLGYSQKAIFQWEVGITNPKLSQLVDWAQVFGMRLTLEELKDD